MINLTLNVYIKGKILKQILSSSSYHLQANFDPSIQDQVRTLYVLNKSGTACLWSNNCKWLDLRGFCEIGQVSHSTTIYPNHRWKDKLFLKSINFRDPKGVRLAKPQN